jgi:hypothetical protein
VWSPFRDLARVADLDVIAERFRIHVSRELNPYRRGAKSALVSPSIGAVKTTVGGISRGVRG